MGPQCLATRVKYLKFQVSHMSRCVNLHLHLSLIFIMKVGNKNETQLTKFCQAVPQVVYLCVRVHCNLLWWLMLLSVFYGFVKEARFINLSTVAWLGALDSRSVNFRVHVKYWGRGASKCPYRLYGAQLQVNSCIQNMGRNSGEPVHKL